MIEIDSFMNTNTFKCIWFTTQEPCEKSVKEVCMDDSFTYNNLNY